MGRFTQPDPLIQDVTDPQTLNPYTYVRNNPLRLVDPNGRAFGSSSGGFGSFGSGIGSFGSLGDFASGFSAWAFNATWSFNFQAFQRLGSFTASSFNASMTGALLTLQDLGPSFSKWGEGIGEFSLEGTRNPLTQMAIGAMTKGATAYYREWSHTLQRFAPEWRGGYTKAVGFQKSFQLVSLTQGVLGYSRFYSQLENGQIEADQFQAAVSIYTTGLILKTAGVALGADAGIFLGTALFPGVGQTYGAVIGAVVIGTIAAEYINEKMAGFFQAIGVQ